MVSQRLAGLAGTLLLKLAAVPAFAQSTPPRMIGGLSAANLCSAVETQTYELDPFHETILYQYQTLLYREAGVTAADNEEVVNQKLRSFLNTHLPEMQCNMINFNPRNGNILKLAAARQASPFIDDALLRWKIDINLVDAIGGFTVLDYIEQRDDTDKPGRTSVYKTIYKQFRAAGAPDRFEIAATGKPLPPAKSTTQAVAKFESKAQAGDGYAASPTPTATCRMPIGSVWAMPA